MSGPIDLELNRDQDERPAEEGRGAGHNRTRWARWSRDGQGSEREEKRRILRECCRRGCWYSVPPAGRPCCWRLVTAA